MCDDHQLLREGIVKIINEFGDCTVIGDSFQWQHLLSLLQSGVKPAVFLLDINMPPGINGYAVCKQIRLFYPNINIIGFSAYSAKSDFIDPLVPELMLQPLPVLTDHSKPIETAPLKRI